MLGRYVSVFDTCLLREARAGLVGVELRMPHDARLGIGLMQRAQHLVEHHQLFGRAVVLVPVFGRSAVSALVADAYRPRVVAPHMASHHGHGASVVERTVAPHIQMIAGIVAETSALVVGT